MRKQVESTKKPGNDYYAKTKDQEDKDRQKVRRTVLGRT
jgi:hypothetical protein